MTEREKLQKDLRRLLTSRIKGPETDRMLKALSVGDSINKLNLLAVKDQMRIATATGRFLEDAASNLGVNKPAGVGLDDDVFRDLTIKITNNKVVKNVLLDVLEVFYGTDAVKANVQSTISEPFNLEEGMQIFIENDTTIDDPLVVEFSGNEFSNINQAKAIEVANVISTAALSSNINIIAEPVENPTTGETFVRLLSGTKGSKSSITITGGEAQNVLRFPQLRNTTQQSGTQLSVTLEGGLMRVTWVGGADPGFQFISEGDYVNIFGSGFDSDNQGTFTIQNINVGPLGQSFFEVENINFTSQGTVTLASEDDIRFFNPVTTTLQSLNRFASIFEVRPNEITVFLPATTRIVRRDRRGAAHLNKDTPNSKFPGSFIFNPQSGFTVGRYSADVKQDLVAGDVYRVIETSNVEDFPNEEGFVVFDFGKTSQEGPIRYFSRPSFNTLFIDPSYVFQKTHLANETDVTFVSNVRPHSPSVDGSDLGFYLTDTVIGRIRAEELINNITAAGIFVNVIIVFPEGPGLNDVEFVYAGDFE